MNILLLKAASTTVKFFVYVCVSVAVRVGGSVTGVGAVGGVCSPAGGRAGATDSAVGASSIRSSRGRCSSVFH